ncbi:hypothetical protein TRAPUB_481 [Trametes pubescens]|uniref:Uncharacterized protein n=1 Tax=Trametes pubescens TaxID=154538 RepID=A0A1M2VM60_TRAPU|nr:hypothetical protein TRAPUB_481 [Trametes pubescens]
MQPAQSPAFPFDPLGHYKAKDVVLAFSKHTPQATPTGYVYFVPLPKDVDSDWCVALEYQGESQGIVMDWFHRADLERFSGRTEAFLDNFLPGNYRRGAGDSVLPETSLYMMEAVLPNEDAFRSTRAGTIDLSADPTFTNLLRQLFLMQKVWFDFMVSPGPSEFRPTCIDGLFQNRMETPLFKGVNNGVWRSWAINPREDCIHVIAIRRTLPDPKTKRVYYFLQLKLCPKA